MTDREARAFAETRALMLDVDSNTADAIADRVMVLWDPEYTMREWIELIDVEIALHLQE